MKMKLKLALFSFLLFCCSGVSAQNARGYIFFAPGGETALGSKGGTTSAYGAGGGVELLLTPHFGVGAEASAVVPAQGPASNTLGIFSVSSYGHLWRDRSFDPYILGGYSVAFRDFSGNGGNFGLGTNYWFHENVGLVLEGRDHYFKLQGIPAHVWEFRIGLTFR